MTAPVAGLRLESRFSLSAIANNCSENLGRLCRERTQAVCTGTALGRGKRFHPIFQRSSVIPRSPRATKIHGLLHQPDLVSNASASIC